jgi:hypothetical protein
LRIHQIIKRQQEICGHGFRGEIRRGSREVRVGPAGLTAAAVKNPAREPRLDFRFDPLLDDIAKLFS